MDGRYNTCWTEEGRAKRHGHSVTRSFSLLRFCIWSVLVFSPQAIERAEGARTASTRFDLQVLPALTGKLRIVGPPNTTITHDGTNNDQPFGLQQWAIQDNDKKNGATVTFQTRTAFRNTTASGTVKRDARLSLSIARQNVGGKWVVTQATDQTNYAAGDELAIVSATSTDMGDATFNIFVTFVTSDFSTMRAGTYSTTVIGTVTKN